MKKGISLIVLIITIIVIIILAGAVILSLVSNNSIEEANKGVFLNDVRVFQTELDLYHTNESIKTQGAYAPNQLFADENTIRYNGQTITGDIITLIPSLGKTNNYLNEFEVIAGEIWYKGADEIRQNWAKDDAKIKVNDGKIIVAITTSQTLPVKVGKDVKYAIYFSYNIGITNINLNGKIKITDESGNDIAVQPVIEIGTPSGTSADKSRTVDIVIKTTGMVKGKYKVKVLANAVESINGATNKEESISTALFEIDDTVVANAPVLAAAMTPIKWDGMKLVTTDASDPSWYNYTDKQWANAQTADGSMWVWIPRYEYKIPSPHISGAQTINVKFIDGIGITATSGYTIHPAFTFGNIQLTGIWVAKFEATGTTSAIEVKPDITSLRNVTMNSMFTACRNMETNGRYGWGTSGRGIDTHLMKNSEWGAIAYFSRSKYGKTSEVWINPDNYNITGRAGTSLNAKGSATTYPYNNTQYGVNASTTGNVYGVYDMSGGAYDCVAAYVNNGNSQLGNGSVLVAAPIQYKDVYTSSGDTQIGNYTAASEKKGDAVYETSSNGNGSYSWYGDQAQMPYSANPFFARGGFLTTESGAGVFAFNSYDGKILNGYRFSTSAGSR